MFIVEGSIGCLSFIEDAASSKERFKARHQIEDMVVVADGSGRLSAANLTMLDEAGHRFNRGSTVDLELHFRLALRRVQRWYNSSTPCTPKIGNNADNDAALKLRNCVGPGDGHPSSWRWCVGLLRPSANPRQQDPDGSGRRGQGPPSGVPAPRGKLLFVKAATSGFSSDEILLARALRPSGSQGLRHEHPRPPDVRDQADRQLTTTCGTWSSPSAGARADFAAWLSLVRRRGTRSVPSPHDRVRPRWPCPTLLQHRSSWLFAASC